MKNLSAISGLICFMLLATPLTGCAAASAAGSPVSSAEPAEAAAEQRVAIMGEIVETVGNMITLNLMETREAPQMTEEERAAMRESFGENGENAPFQRGQGEMLEGGFPEGGMPEGGFPGGEMPEGGFPEEGMPGGGRTLTGETKEIVIPTGAPVMEITGSGEARGESEISIDKLKAGDVIEVTYASDNETVAKVVKQSSQGGGMRFGGSQEE